MFYKPTSFFSPHERIFAEDKEEEEERRRERKKRIKIVL